MSIQTVDPQRWQRIKQLVADAAERAPVERAAFLAAECSGDEAMQREVEALLAGHDEAGDFFERRPVLSALPPAMSLTASSVQLTAGYRLGHYEIVEAIGAGGMGEVYKARDTRLNRTVAIKVLPADVAHDLQARERFEREARAVAALSHPHICALYDVGEAALAIRPPGVTNETVRYLVMEYLEGETLAERLARLRGRKLPIHEALSVAIEIASALDRAHHSGIVHRDLKPANVMLTKTGAKLLDFGLAKATRDTVAGSPAMTGAKDLTAPGLIIGTVRYMAPEQIEGKDVDERTDIFAFGLMLFEMLTGRRPFEGNSDAGVMASILERDPPLVSSVQPLATAALDRIVSTCLAKDRDDRWQTARDLLRELRWIREASAQGGEATVVVRRNSRRSINAALAIGVLALVAGASYFAGARTTPKRATSVRVDRLTDFPGLEEYPAISPDGRSVAFTANAGGMHQIFVKLIGGGPPLQLTRDASEHLRPRWTPDSSSLIYFSRPLGGGLMGTLWEISALGGTPRRIVDSPADGDVSHDGRRLAFVRSTGGRLELVTTDRDGINTKVIVPLAPGYSYISPRWSPDDTLIAYQRSRVGLDHDVFVVPAGGGEPRGISTHAKEMNGFAWLPDGSGIVMSSSRGSTMYYLPSFNLWTVSLKDGAWRQETFGEVSYLHPDVDRRGALTATRFQMQSDIWRFPVAFDGVENVRRGERITRQTGQVRTPTVGPGDKEVAYLSDSGGHANIWVTKLDTGESRQITYERDPEVSVGVPVWSPDGRHIVFASGRDAQGQNGYWLVSPDGSGLRNLKLHAGWAGWSGDSRWVYYSDDPRREDPRRAVVWKVAIDGGQPVVVRPDMATRPAISRDGSALYWLVEVLGGSGFADYEIRTASPEDGPARTLARIPTSRVPIWLMIHPVISPDGKWLALPLVDNGTTNIWAVSTTDGALRQLTDFGRRSTFIARRVSWSSDGRSVFAALGEGEADVVLLAGLAAR
jgi:serine/threonine protein kinase/Tol biopolymer transport system component